MNVENKRDDRKKKIREIAGGILCIAVLLFIVMQIMLPETGIGGMVNEGSMAVLYFSHNKGYGRSGESLSGNKSFGVRRL